MAERTGISWADRTFNPWMGCEKVSPGCARCYAETLMDKRYHKISWGRAGTRIRTTEAYWNKARAWNREPWLKCSRCSWRGSIYEAGIDNGKFACPKCAKSVLHPTRQRVFCASLADVFEDRPELVAWRRDLFTLIRETPNLDWLILTKRPENIFEMCLGSQDHDYSYPNVWWGTSVENQATADQRILDLINVPFAPGAIRFLSVEPMLEKIDIGLFGTVPKYTSSNYRLVYEYVSWVICGGESGRGFRPMDVAWAEDLFMQCREAEVPFFMKQLGGHPDKRDKMEDFPVGLQVQQFPQDSFS